MANLCDVSLFVSTTGNRKFNNKIEKEIEKELQSGEIFSEVHLIESDEHYIEAEGFVKWAIGDNVLDAMVRLSEKYKLKLRAVGREDANGFVQVVCVNKGLVVQDEEINYLL